LGHRLNLFSGLPSFWKKVGFYLADQFKDIGAHQQHPTIIFSVDYLRLSESK
jgi:hypothetical protein